TVHASRDFYNWVARYAWLARTTADNIPVTLRSNFDGKCMEVAGASPNVGAQIDQATCTYGTNQLWYEMVMNDGSSQFVSISSAMCLEKGTDNVLRQDDCYSSRARQRFLRSFTASGVFTMQEEDAGLCVDIPFQSTANGLYLWLFPCTRGPTQQWKMA